MQKAPPERGLSCRMGYLSKQNGIGFGPLRLLLRGRPPRAECGQGRHRAGLCLCYSQRTQARERTCRRTYWWGNRTGRDRYGSCAFHWAAARRTDSTGRLGQSPSALAALARVRTETGNASRRSSRTIGDSPDTFRGLAALAQPAARASAQLAVPGHACVALRQLQGLASFSGRALRSLRDVPRSRRAIFRFVECVRLRGTCAADCVFHKHNRANTLLYLASPNSTCLA